MRFDTHANRVRYGVPIFVTSSPDEAHNLLMVRLSRVRRKDPVLLVEQESAGRRYCGREAPNLAQDLADDIVLGVPLEDLLARVPSYDERRAILARDPLAAVDGFRITVRLAYEHVFGMRVCAYCPDCNSHEYGLPPCQDIFGSNATAEGGSFGRVDAGYTSIEAQKATGSLHAHSQIFVQCIHQHTPLEEVLNVIRAQPQHVAQRYLRYKATYAARYMQTLQTSERV